MSDLRNHLIEFHQTLHDSLGLGNDVRDFEIWNNFNLADL